MRRNKLNTLVEFPVEDLDMWSHVVHHRDHAQHHDDMSYDLIAVANHYGNMMGGHYTGNSWFCYEPFVVILVNVWYWGHTLSEHFEI